MERRERVVRVVVDRDGGVDLEAIAEATRAVSGVLDVHDPVPGRYTLEVSSPGVERPLRTPAHFARAVGETVSVRTLAGGEGERRVTGRLTEADAEGFVLDCADTDGGRRRLAYDEVQRARTVFAWGARPTPERRRAGPVTGARLARSAAPATRRGGRRRWRRHEQDQLRVPRRPGPDRP